MSVYPTPVKNFYRSTDIAVGDGVVAVIDRPIVLKSFSLNVTPSPVAVTTGANSFTVKMFDGSSEIVRVYDGANPTVAHQGSYGRMISTFCFKFPSNGIRILNSLGLSIALTAIGAPFVITDVSVMYQD